MIESNNINLKSWIDVPSGHIFPIQNLPFGIFSTSDRSARPGVAIGDNVLDLQTLSEAGFFDSLGFNKSDFSASTLNPIINKGKAATSALRNRISELLRSDSAELKDSYHASRCLVAMGDVEMHMPVKVGDYTDCYSSEDHATNVGKMFRDPDNALLPNWKHMPVAYHGRASSIVVSGTPIKRPQGQLKPYDDQPPIYGPSRLLDFELEMAFITHPGKGLGETIDVVSKPNSPATTRATLMGWYM